MLCVSRTKSTEAVKREQINVIRGGNVADFVESMFRHFYCVLVIYFFLVLSLSLPPHSLSPLKIQICICLTLLISYVAKI